MAMLKEILEIIFYLFSIKVLINKSIKTPSTVLKNRRHNMDILRNLNELLSSIVLILVVLKLVK